MAFRVLLGPYWQAMGCASAAENTELRQSRRLPALLECSAGGRRWSVVYRSAMGPTDDRCVWGGSALVASSNVSLYIVPCSSLEVVVACSPMGEAVHGWSCCLWRCRLHRALSVLTIAQRYYDARVVHGTLGVTRDVGSS